MEIIEVFLQPIADAVIGTIAWLLRLLVKAPFALIGWMTERLSN